MVLALDRAKAGAVEERLPARRAAGESLHASSLLRHEIVSALTRAVDTVQVGVQGRAGVAGDRRRADQVHELETGTAVVEVVPRLGRRSRYDAAYAQALGAELWTLDGPLARNARGLGLPVRLVDPA